MRTKFQNKINRGWIILLFAVANAAWAQDTLELSFQETETIFLKNNLTLLAQYIEVEQSEAEIIQAKIWPNPTLSIEEVNVWRPKSLQGEEIIPSFAGDWSSNQQFAIELEQEIITGGKRKKLMELKRLGAEKSVLYFEELLRELKLEFRQKLYQLEYLQDFKTVYINQLESIKQLTTAFKNQVDRDFIDKGEYIRLRATYFSILKEVNELENEIEELQYSLKYMMQIPSSTEIILKSEHKNPPTPLLLPAVDLLDSAKNNRPEMLRWEMEEKIAQQSFWVEKANRAPTLSAKMNYNRGDGPYLDFIGFGIAIGLPVFDRNQGNIKIASLETERITIKQNDALSVLEKEINVAYQHYQKAIAFYHEIDESFEEDLNQVLKAYTENLERKNIDLVTYLDFLEAYIDNQSILLEITKEIQNKREILNHAVGMEIIP